METTATMTTPATATAAATTGTTSENVRPKLVDVEAQPILDRDGNEIDEETRRKIENERTLVTRIIQGSAIACIVINIVAMALYGGGVVIIAGIIGAVVSGGVIYYQEQLRDDDSLRMVQNELRHKVNEFADENNKLTSTINQLEGQLIPLKETEAKLEQIASKNGSTVERMKELLKINKSTLDQMRASLEADVLNSMMDVVLKADRSEDGAFSKSEISALTLRLKMLPTIEMNEARFKEAMGNITESNRQIAELMKLFEQIHDDTLPESERVFKLSSDAISKV